MSNVPKNNVKYSFSKDGLYGYGEMYDGTTFIFDADLFDLIKDVKWYVGSKGKKQRYVMDSHGRTLHQVLFSVKKGFKLDHINLNTFCYLRY